MKKLGLLALLIAMPAVCQARPQIENPTQAVEGCLTQVNGDFVLQPLPSGASIYLSAGNQDLSPYVGKRVRVRGTEQKPSPDQQTSAARNPVTPVEKQPASSAQPSGTPDPNVQVTQLPQSAQAGSGTEGFRGSSQQQLYVTSIQPSAGTCNSSREKHQH